MSTDTAEYKRVHNHLPETVKEKMWKHLKRAIIPGKGFKPRTVDGEGGLGPRWTLVSIAEYLSEVCEHPVTKFNVQGMLERRGVYWEVEREPKSLITLGGPETHFSDAVRLERLEKAVAALLKAGEHQLAGARCHGEALKEALAAMQKLNDDMTCVFKFLTDRYGPMWRDKTNGAAGPEGA